MTKTHKTTKRITERAVDIDNTSTLATIESRSIYNCKSSGTKRAATKRIISTKVYSKDEIDRMNAEIIAEAKAIRTIRSEKKAAKEDVEIKEEADTKTESLEEATAKAKDANYIKREDTGSRASTGRAATRDAKEHAEMAERHAKLTAEAIKASHRTTTLIGRSLEKHSELIKIYIDLMHRNS